MIRVEQPLGERGSLKWIQLAVNSNAGTLDHFILPKLDGVKNIRWRSPRSDDGYAEYRDFGFLERLGIKQLGPELEKFWPNRGPQWDALARCDDGSVLLIEAKAHILELCSPPSKASPASLEKIQKALDRAASFIGAEPRASWSEVFYQLTNRIAHLYFLRKHGVKAWLILVNFVGDAEMRGPSSEEEWRAAYQVVWHVLGMPKRHKLSAFIAEIFPNVEAWR